MTDVPGNPASAQDRADVVFFANTEWYFYNFRRSLAEAVRTRGQKILLISPDGPFGPRLRELGFRWEPLDMDRRSLRPDKELRLISDLVRIYKREKPSLIHNFTIKCAVYGSIAGRLAGVPSLVNSITGFGYTFTSGALHARVLAPVVKSLMQLTLAGARARLIVQNPDDEDFFRKLGFSNDLLRLIPGSGVNCSRFVPRPQNAASNARPMVLFVGRLLWDKGLAEFVEAAQQLAGVDCEFVIAGAPDTGNPASVPLEILNGWVASGTVTWLGQVDDMPGLLAKADVFVLPSYREGLPRSLIEAAACGLPLVATDVPGCREVVQHEINGLLVPVRDSKALAKAILRLLTDKNLAAKLGASAREKAVLEFEERIIIARTLSVYDELNAGLEKRQLTK
jgi:glycosyltransferase involved in cell wall biosynthesis